MEPEKTPRERAEDLISLLVPDWRPTARQGLWAIRIVLAIVVVLGILTLVGQPFGITLWDWIKLLVVPAVLAGGGLWFNRQQREREQQIANERAQDAALQAYLDKMSELLIDGQLRKERDRYADKRITARARTLAVLGQLDNGGRKKTILLFLREARLINRKDRPCDWPKVNPPIVGLKDADLKNANLRDAKLINTDQNEPISLEGANLEGADLQGADLQGANLQNADLKNANLRDAKLINTDQNEPVSLEGANLEGTNLEGADLQGADLQGANLQKTNLNKADLTGANLSGANLYRARGWTADQLRATRTLEGATMPYGKKFED